MGKRQRALNLLNRLCAIEHGGSDRYEVVKVGYKDGHSHGGVHATDLMVELLRGNDYIIYKMHNYAFYSF
jgi:hypothetical protein